MELNNKFECESCGRIVEKNDIDETWESSQGREICGSCMFHYLEVLNEVYDSNTLVRAKKIIEKYDDEFDESFLKNRI